MFKFMKKNADDQASKVSKRNAKKLAAVAFALACVPQQIICASAAEGDGSLSTIVSDGTTVVTTVMGTIWTFITGNAYTSFAVAVSVICAVIMIFKRLVGAARR